MKEFLQRCRYYFKYAFFFSFFISLLQLTFPIYMLMVYDKVMSSQNMATLVVITIAAGFALLIMGVLTWIRSRLLVRAGIEFNHLLAHDVLSTNLREAGTPSGPPPNHGTLGDVQTLRNFLSGAPIFAFFDIPWMPLYFAILFLMHPALGWFSVAGGIFILFLGWLTERVTSKRLLQAGSINAASGRFTNVALRNADIVRSMGMVGNVVAKWKSINRDAVSLQTIASSKAGLLNALVRSTRLGMQVMIYAIGAYLALCNLSTAGIMIAASIIMGRALAPIDQAMATYKNSINAYGAYRRLQALLKDETRATPMPLPEPTGELSAENLFFATQGKQIIKGISFRINPGVSLAIIGASASGKSTLCKLLLNLWPPTAGKVRLDRADISQWDPELLGPFLGYLPQEVDLFGGTVAENICRLGERDPEKIIHAAKLAGVHEMILQLPKGYDTQIGDGGSNLSGGQRQRLGLARAVYGDPRIVILDEPNSNLDEEGERCLAQTLLYLRKNRTTVIVVTHKPQILGMVDNIMLMQDGQVIMSGPCRQVLEKLSKLRQQQEAGSARHQQSGQEQISEDQGGEALDG